MKKIIITSVAALAVIGSANASMYIAGTDEARQEWNSWLDMMPEGTKQAVNTLAQTVNANTAEFDGVHQVINDWNQLFFGENGDMTDGLFYSYYRKDGGIQKRLSALENGTIADDMAAGFGQLSHEINKVSKELSAGVANVAALSAVAVSDVKQGEVSFGGGYGYHNSQSAVAFGTAVGLTDNWSMNAGVGFNDYDVTVRAGTNVKFKLF